MAPLPLSWPGICPASTPWQEHVSIYSLSTSLNININTSSLHIRGQLPGLHRFVTQEHQKEQRRCCRKRQEGEEERATKQGTRRVCSHKRVPGRQPKLYFDIIVSRSKNYRALLQWCKVVQTSVDVAFSRDKNPLFFWVIFLPDHVWSAPTPVSHSKARRRAMVSIRCPLCKSQPLYIIL